MNHPAEGKYVIRQNGEIKLFPHVEIHSFYSCGCPEKDCEGRAIAAGFYEISDDGKVLVSGVSMSLRVRSRPQDAELIKKYLRSV